MGIIDGMFGGGDQYRNMMNQVSQMQDYQNQMAQQKQMMQQMMQPVSINDLQYDYARQACVKPKDNLSISVESLEKIFKPQVKSTNVAWLDKQIESVRVRL